MSPTPLIKGVWVVRGDVIRAPFCNRWPQLDRHPKTRGANSHVACELIYKPVRGPHVNWPHFWDDQVGLLLIFVTRGLALGDVVAWPVLHAKDSREKASRDVNVGKSSSRLQPLAQTHCSGNNETGRRQKRTRNLLKINFLPPSKTPLPPPPSQRFMCLFCTNLGECYQNNPHQLFGGFFLRVGLLFPFELSQTLGNEYGTNFF